MLKMDQKFNVYGNFNAAVSLNNVVGENENDALVKASEILSDNIADIKLVFQTVGGNVVELKLHDSEMKWQRAFGEGE